MPVLPHETNIPTGFVYVGYSELHPPMMANPSFPKSTERSGLIADLIAEMDCRIGQVLDAVKEAGIDDNTIFVLSSDDAGGGAMPQTGTSSNGPWRGDSSTRRLREACGRLP
jgi:arylsulfatase A-like enzyme